VKYGRGASETCPVFCEAYGTEAVKEWSVFFLEWH